jgi:release factor glutamine methyltransferase
MNSQAKLETFTVRSALREAIAQIAEANTPSHSLAAELLLMHVLGRDRAWLYSHPEAPLAQDVADKFFNLVAQRARSVPTQYLTGVQEFWGLPFEVTPAVLIPRPETEHVIEVVLERIGPAHFRDQIRIADIGTGSGCIAVALATELPAAEIHATDISAAALEVARRNAQRHCVSERIHFAECDLLPSDEAGAYSFDIIVSNPPYVAETEKSELQPEVRLHEPSQALFAGPNGTEIYPRLITLAAARLRSGGFLVLEIGFGARDKIQPLFESASWNNIRVSNDLAGIPRVVSAQRL